LSEDCLRSAEVKRLPTERRIEHRRTNGRRVNDDTNNFVTPAKAGPIGNVDPAFAGKIIRAEPG